MAKHKKKKQSENTKPSSKPKSAMTKMLELSDIVFKITMISMCRVLNEKVNNVQAQMDNLSRDGTL